MKHLDHEGIEIMKQLVSDIQGAPYPNVVDNELYRIWYEHVQIVASKCLEYIDRTFPNEKKTGKSRNSKFKNP
ncbi:hypothetical protein K7I13_03115 [Brucepastera parasyntrophica]|uniref:hypothetical protein n=1 Tax=Brucepastera parasyntrophica TaxID=2880008 RepID=UPI00210ABC43|nr:hypothetical protein [Brucepastera parasyntrophica]ULQ60313.1 hypothetical protein K7I13_03115 [Brucepastera parasyntrophica]